MMLITMSVLITVVINSLHEVIKKFLFHNATMSSSALDEHLFYCSPNRLADQAFYGRLLLLSQSNLLNSCVGKCSRPTVL